MAAREGAGWAFPAACVLAVATVVGAYANSFENSFHFDDTHVVVSNIYIRSLRNLPLFFLDASTGSSLPANQVYRPLVTASLAVDYWLGGGLPPRQFHRTQLAMLLVLGALLYLLFRRLMDLARAHWWNRYAALAAAVFFSVHTTGTEAMNLIHVRSELISGIGVVGSFLVYLCLPGSRRAHLYLLPMMIGALAKSPSVMFAPLFLVYLVLFEQELSVPDLFDPRRWAKVRAAIARSLPAFAAGAAVFAAIAAMDAPAMNYGGGDRIDYLRTQLYAWLHYGRLFVAPVGLTTDSDWRLIGSWFDTRVLAGLAFVALLLGVLWVSSKTRIMRPVAFGVSWFALALLPASSVVPLAEVVNEHRPFFAYVGLALAAAWGLAVAASRWAERSPRGRAAAAPVACTVALVAIGGNAVGTYERNRVFLSEETLWRDVTEKSPTNGRGLMNYGLTHMARGRYAEAKALFDRALVYNPNYATLEVNLGIVTNRLGQPEAAESHFKRALQLGPNDPASHSFYAGWLLEHGRADEAIGHLQRAVELSPGNLAARHELMRAYAGARRGAELKALAEETRRLAPGDAEAGRFLNDRGEVVIPDAPASAAGTPGDWLNVSLARYRAGDFQGSIDAARKALELQPGYAEAYNNIAAAHASLKQWDPAVEAAREALRLKPDFPLARNNLRWAEGEQQKARQAGR